MPPLSPESFSSPPEAEPPIIPCRPAMAAEGHRALAGSAREAELVLVNLRRRAQELGLEVFARRVSGLTTCLREAREELARRPR